MSNFLLLRSITVHAYDTVKRSHIHITDYKFEGGAERFTLKKDGDENLLVFHGLPSIEACAEWYMRHMGLEEYGFHFEVLDESWYAYAREQWGIGDYYDDVFEGYEIFVEKIT